MLLGTILKYRRLRRPSLQPKKSQRWMVPKTESSLFLLINQESLMCFVTFANRQIWQIQLVKFGSPEASRNSLLTLLTG